MLVYGDVECVETVGDKRKAIENFLKTADEMPPGAGRHATLTAAFITTSELVQGLIDADFQNRGVDALSPIRAVGMECLSLMAQSLLQSWWSGFADGTPPQAFRDKLFSFDQDLTIRAKQAEGYAFYALYPESYGEAALQSGLGPNTRVIGIRSIGAGLGAIVASALKASPAFTVRPAGHPFRRELKVDPATAETLTRDKKATFAIVDEGPGLSGSSFGAVADWLESMGVDRERIHFFPSHLGQLGHQASAGHRERWAAARRHFVSMDQLLLDEERPHLRRWAETVVGPLRNALEDISGGAWRTRRYPQQDTWPAANLQQERRKFLATTPEATWLLKFAGLGEIGLRKHEQAQQLHGAGFTPEVAGFCHGFLVERWHEHAPSLDRHPVAPAELLNRLGAYLAFRARHFAAEPYQGATLAQLREMACYNTKAALGDQAALALDQALPQAEALEDHVQRVFTDNRMQPWEWLIIDGRPMKTDALDHCAAHDLIGCQDITWDIAGAAIEFSLRSAEIERLCAIVQGESGRSVSQALLSFMRPCYLAFQLGAQTMAADALNGSDEEARLRSSAQRYGLLLQRYISRPDRLSFIEEQDRVPVG